MLWAIAIVLGVLLALGLASTASVGAYHVVVAVALALVGYAIIRRRRERRLS